MTWQPTRPSSNDYISSIPAILEDNWDAIEDIFGISHETIAGSATSAGTDSGRHTPGEVGVLQTGSQTTISALTSPVTGAMALVSGAGVEVHDGGEWRQLYNNGWSHMRAYLGASKNLTACQTSASDTQQIIFDIENYDMLGNYDNTTGIFTALSTAPYVIIASLCLCGAAATCATSVTATPTSSEWYSENSSTCISSSSILATADRAGADSWWIHPTASTTYKYECVVDKTTTLAVTADVSTDGSPTQFFGFADQSSLPVIKTLQGMTSADTASVTVCAYHERNSYAGFFKLGLDVGGTKYYSTVLTASSSPSWQDYTWTTNPKTSAVWLSAELSARDNTNGIRAFGIVLSGSISNSNNNQHLYYIEMKYAYRLKNWSLVSDSSDSTYVFNAASPSVGGIPPIDIFKAEGYSSVFPYNMPISAVRIKVTAAGDATGGKDFICGTLQFPDGVSAVTTESYSTSGCDPSQWLRHQYYANFTDHTGGDYLYDKTLSATDDTASDFSIGYSGYHLTWPDHIHYWSDDYIGFSEPFNRIDIDVGQAGVYSESKSLAASAWDGSAWVGCTSLVDGTNAFQTTGRNSIRLGYGGTWAARTITSDQGPVTTSSSLYWLKLQTVTLSTGTATTVACGTRAWVYPRTTTFPSIILTASGGGSALGGTFSEYSGQFVLNPCIGAALTATTWTAAQVNASGTSAISGWGYNFSTATSGASVSEARMYVIGALVPQDVTFEVRKGASEVFRRVHDRFHIAATEMDHTLTYFETVYLTAGTQLRFYLTKYTYNDVLSAGSEHTFLAISRISGRCF